ncbi:hypothetical protein OU5_P0206 (plasmid) [Pseudomonas mandelii JR-1]|uniref:Uncharacterized protein n=1 Tax=Pseudomonas mandelii JR-1 TaxID=1147786 RepID=A0A024EM31_9PSED|nr:hypothetical protein OU5_P0206 [Pseudomonas mandelii JR-1]
MITVKQPLPRSGIALQRTKNLRPVLSSGHIEEVQPEEKWNADQ